MYISLCAIRSWNWNWKLTQDNFLIERWIQLTHRCSAVRCWPWGIFRSWLASRDLGTTRPSYLAWVGPVLKTHNCAHIHCENIARHTAHKFFSWANPKQWPMIHISNFMIMTRWSTNILTIIEREMGMVKTLSRINSIKENCKNGLDLKSTLRRIYCFILWSHKFWIFMNPCLGAKMPN